MKLRTKDDRPFSAEITPSKNQNITDNRKFRKRRSKTFAEALQSIGTPNFDGKFYETLKAPNVLGKKITILTESDRYRFRKYIY